MPHLPNFKANDDDAENVKQTRFDSQGNGAAMSERDNKNSLCRCLLLAIIGMQTSLLFGADSATDETLKSLSAQATATEKLLLSGVHWEWLCLRGTAPSLDAGRKGEFEKAAPVDQYQGNWRCNQGTYLYKSIAQQDVREIPTNTPGPDQSAKNYVTLTQGSDIYLFTPDSRLIYHPSRGIGGFGLVQNKEHGFMEARPSKVLLYCGQFGLGQLPEFLNRMAQADDVQVTVEDGQTENQEAALVVHIHWSDEVTQNYYFHQKPFALLQYEWIENGTTTEIAIADSTKTLDIKGQEVMVPSNVTSCTQRDDGSWSLDRYRTSTVEFDPAPLSAMQVHLEEALIVVHPSGAENHIKAPIEVTPKTLDDFVADQFAKAKLRPKRADVPDSRKWLLIVTGIIAVTGAAVYAGWRLRRRRAADRQIVKAKGH